MEYHQAVIGTAVAHDVVNLMQTCDAFSGAINQIMDLDLQKEAVMQTAFLGLDEYVQPCPWTYFDKEARKLLINGIDDRLTREFKARFKTDALRKNWLTNQLHKLWTLWAGVNAEFTVDRITDYKFSGGIAWYLTEYVGHKWAEWKPYTEVSELLAFQIYCDTHGRDPENPGKQAPAPRKRRGTGIGRGNGPANKRRKLERQALEERHAVDADDVPYPEPVQPLQLQNEYVFDDHEIADWALMAAEALP
jgi:hypothetical protein